LWRRGNGREVAKLGAESGVTLRRQRPGRLTILSN
jgi:hypothetical protein